MGALILGQRALSDRRLLRSEGHQDPGRGERLSGRALRGTAELGGEGVSETDPLQQARQGRALRGLGAAGALRRRDARGVQISPQTNLNSTVTWARASCARRLPHTMQPFEIRRRTMDTTRKTEDIDYYR